MLLDIGIPCFNDSKYLLKCLESIDEQFIDNYNDIKVWVIDDDSPYGEDYKKVISQFKNFKIELIKKKQNSGPGPCRNEVIIWGNADYITWIDDDDIFISNPLKNEEIFTKKPDVVRSEVYTQENKLYVGTNDYTTCVFGSIFKREFLKKNNFMFFPHLGIVGTEDPVFMILTNASTSSILITNSFIQYTRRPDSQYTLNCENEIVNCAISLLPLCNLCYMTKYKNSIKNFKLLWDEIEEHFMRVLKECARDSMYPYTEDYFLLIAYLVLFKIIRGFFPNKEDIKPYIKDSNLMPHIYYAYHFCKDEDEDTMYCQFKSDKFINTDNFLKPLASPGFFTTLHFSSLYNGLIKYPCADMVKRGRKAKGYPEKYWNF